MIERKRYLELCQMNAVNPESAKVMCDKYGEYYPKSYTIDFNDKGETIHYCTLKDLKANCLVSAFLCDLKEVE